MRLPLYLQNKLSQWAITSIADLRKFDYCEIFAWLRDKYPSQSYNTLYDLYCLSLNLPLNSLDDKQKQQVKNQYKSMSPCYMPLSIQTMYSNLDLASEQSKIAELNNEIPIGAIITWNNKNIAAAYNQGYTTNDLTSHAEVLAIKKAQRYLNTRYLKDCDLYVTLEPCLFCSGVIIASRLKRLIFGACEPKTGACISQYQVFANNKVNHHTQVIGPIDTNYAQYLQRFLKNKR